MTTYTTQQGDAWDSISKSLYGSERYMDKLIRANIEHRKTVLFSYGVKLNVPDVSTSSAADQPSLPPWKRTGSA